MEEEIDLRAYIEVLLRHWYWILGLALLAAAVALGVSLLLTPTYEATAVVIITTPRYNLQFDSRFQTVSSSTPAYRAFPRLATSDEVLQRVVDSYSTPAAARIENWSLRTLSGMAEATSEGDPSLVLLSVRCASPQAASEIANLWADEFARLGNEIYGRTEDDVAFFVSQVAHAEQALGEAEAALTAFEARNETGTLQAQLASYRQMQTDYLTSQQTISNIILDVHGFMEQLAELPDDQPVSPADSVTALLLQVKAFNAQSDVPIQVQITSVDPLSNHSTVEQIALLDAMARMLETRSAAIDARLLELEPHVLELQQQLQETRIEHDRLIRTRDLASETYLTLARKMAEASIAAQEESGLIEIGSYAMTPSNPVAPRKLLNTAVAGALGLMVSTLGVLFVDFWHKNTKEQNDGTPSNGQT